MTTYLRSDVDQVNGAGHVHKKKKGEPHLVLDCSDCEEKIRLQAGMWADRPALVPRTEAEEREEEEIQRDVALANAAQGRAMRDEQVSRARTARAQRRS